MATMDSWVEEAGDSIVVLLGAGASAPQLPVSTELTDLVVGHLDTVYPVNDESNIGRTWHEVRRRLAGVTNIEEYFAAIDALSKRDTAISRFWVDEWAEFPSMSTDPAQPPTVQYAAVLLAHQVRITVMQILTARSGTADVSYLRPLVSAPLQGIISTNYDLLIERAADASGVQYSTGAALWDGGIRWFNERHPEGALKLLKVHGSLNWRTSREIIGSPLPILGIDEFSVGQRAPANVFAIDVSIFGLGNKLRSDRAYPALVREIDELLLGAKLLVAIGSSFSDVHITEPIRRWAALNPGAKIIIVDPYRTHSLQPHTPLGELQQGLWDGSGFGDEPGMVNHDRINRLRFVRKTASEGIAELFG